MEVKTPQARFLGLSAECKKAVQIDLCKQALSIWNSFCDEKDRSLKYIETVCGTEQVVDVSLPSAAVEAVLEGSDSARVESRYKEPIVAMQDDDLILPDNIELGYYSIYNLFRRYISSGCEDDWLIANQALSAHGENSDYADILTSSIKRSEQGSGGNG